MLALLDGSSCDRQTEDPTTFTSVSGLSSTSPGPGQHSDGLLRRVHTGSRNRILCIRKQAIFVAENGNKVACFRIQRKLGQSLVMPTLPFSKMFNGFWFGWTLLLFSSNLKFVASPIPVSGTSVDRPLDGLLALRYDTIRRPSQ